MDDPFATMNGGSQYVRYRTGGSPSYTTEITLASASDIEGVSITVEESPDTAGEGYSGIEISTSTDGSTYTLMYARYEMFGNYERSAEHQTPADGWEVGTPFIHRFDNVAAGTTSVRLKMWRADISGDNSITFNSVTVDEVGTYPIGVGGAIGTDPGSDMVISPQTATWSALDGSSNRDGGDMGDITTAVDGNENWVRYRTGGSPGFQVDLVLSEPTDIEGVSMLVNFVDDNTGKGYSGIDISVSTDGGSSYTSVYTRTEMFGSIERSATYETLADDFTWDEYTTHAFTEVASGVTDIRLVFGRADQGGDNCVSFDGIRIDAAGAYDEGTVGGGGLGNVPYITAAMLSEGNQAYTMLTWDFTSGTPSAELFDGDTETPIGGDQDNQHDEIVAVQLSMTCDTSKFKIYGRDRDVPNTDLRHVRGAYSNDGQSWTCYTQSDAETQGGTPSLSDASTNCNEGPSHAPSGAEFSINGAASYVEFAFWGRTDVFEVELTECTVGGVVLGLEESGGGEATVTAVEWSADDGSSNRDGGDIGNPMLAFNGGDQFIRYRTGGSPGYTMDIAVEGGPSIEGVSIMVRQSPNSPGEGYSGIEIFTSSDCSTYTEQYSRYEMFGEFERSAAYSTIAADFEYDQFVIHRFAAVVDSVTCVRLHFGNADIVGDSAFTLNQVRIDLAGSYGLNQGDAIVPEPQLDGWCLLPGSNIVDPYAFSGVIYGCTGEPVRYVVPDGLTPAANGVTYINVWMSGAGGGFGSRAHAPNQGGAAGFAYGSIAVNAGDVLTLYVGCAGETGCVSSDCGQREGGGGGGASAITGSGSDADCGVCDQEPAADSRGNTIHMVAAGAGGQGGGDGNVLTGGGHGGGMEGSTGGNTGCDANIPGGTGGTQTAGGTGGAGNRGYNPGDDADGPNGGAGGGQQNQDRSAGGWGWATGGSGRTQDGDGGGGGGGGGYFGGGGGGAGCHGMGGGGGSSYLGPNRLGWRGGNIATGVGSAEGTDGWIVIDENPEVACNAGVTEPTQTEGPELVADSNGDCRVDVQDLLLTLANFGRTC
jgi:hypothetical protein